MAILDIIKDATKALGLKVPGAVLSSTDREHVELVRAANKMGIEIARAHTWQKLKRIETITGDDSSTSFSLPANYDYMKKDARVWSSRLSGPFRHVSNEDEWLGLTVIDFDTVGSWIIYGGQIHIKPAMASTETAKYFYQSANFCEDSEGNGQTAFVADTDEFRLDDELLTLGIVWRYKDQKGLPYEEDLDDFTAALSDRIEKDGGGDRLIRETPRRLRGVKVAYPFEIGS